MPRKFPRTSLPYAVTVQVSDAENATTTVNWTITVTANGFHFVDAHAAAGSDGSIAHPWRGWTDFYKGHTDTSYNNGEFIYFRTGTYTLPKSLSYGDAAGSLRIMLHTHPRVYLAYPGETVIFDQENGNTPAHLYIPGSDNYYFDGIHFDNGYGFGIEVWGGDNFIVRHCAFTNYGNGSQSANQSAISFRNDALQPDHTQGFEPPVDDNAFKLYAVVQDSSFENIASGGIENYGLKYALYEDNRFNGIGFSAINLKSTDSRTTIRKNYIGTSDNYGISIFAQYYANDTEIVFNFIESLVRIGEYEGIQGPGVTYIYRNTINNQIHLQYIQDDDGPFYFENNVIVNTTPSDHIRDQTPEHWSITANRSIVNDNLFGVPKDDIINIDGTLSDSYVAYRGKFGHIINYTKPLPPNQVQVK